MSMKKAIKIIVVIASLAAAVVGVCMTTLHFRMADYIGTDIE